MLRNVVDVFPTCFPNADGKGTEQDLAKQFEMAVFEFAFKKKNQEEQVNEEETREVSKGLPKTAEVKAQPVALGDMSCKEKEVEKEKTKSKKDLIDSEQKDKNKKFTFDLSRNVTVEKRVMNEKVVLSENKEMERINEKSPDACPHAAGRAQSVTDKATGDGPAVSGMGIRRIKHT
eukprot:PhF_6_TR9232/c1_g1_i3/m.14554